MYMIHNRDALEFTQNVQIHIMARCICKYAMSKLGNLPVQYFLQISIWKVVSTAR